MGAARLGEGAIQDPIIVEGEGATGEREVLGAGVGGIQGRINGEGPTGDGELEVVEINHAVGGDGSSGDEEIGSNRVAAVIQARSGAGDGRGIGEVAGATVELECGAIGDGIGAGVRATGSAYQYCTRLNIKRSIVVKEKVRPEPG